MALPSGILTAPVSFGKSYSYTGVGSKTSLQIIPKDAYGNAVTLIWAATGERIDGFTETAVAEAGVDGLIVLPVTNQTGFLNTNGETLKDWYYESIETPSQPTQSLKPILKRWQLATTAPVDLDLIPDGQTLTSPVSAPIAPVLSVNGATGVVNVEPAGLSDTTEAALSTTYVTLAGDVDIPGVKRFTGNLRATGKVNFATASFSSPSSPRTAFENSQTMIGGNLPNDGLSEKVGFGNTVKFTGDYSQEEAKGALSPHILFGSNDYIITGTVANDLAGINDI